MNDIDKLRADLKHAIARIDACERVYKMYASLESQLREMRADMGEQMDEAHPEPQYEWRVDAYKDHYPPEAISERYARWVKKTFGGILQRRIVGKWEDVE